MEREFALTPVRLEGDGHEITLWKHYFYRCHISTPFRDRAAVKWEGAPPTAENLVNTLNSASLARAVVKDIGWFANEGELPRAADRHFVVRYINADVALDARLESRIRRTTQQVLRKAQRAHEPDVRPDDGGGFEQFYALYLQTRRRLGVIPYSRSFFRYWYDRIGDHTLVLKCTEKSKPLGFILCYLHGEEMIPALMAYDYEHRKKAITDLLHMHAFLWGRNNGFRNYRVGADNPDQQGLMQSKMKLGAVVRDQTDYVRPTRAPMFQLSNSVLRSLIRRTPPTLFRRSSLLTRIYFS